MKSARWTFLLCLIVTVFYSTAINASGKTTKETIVSGKLKRTFYLFAPDKLGAEKSAPLVLMLHGSNRNGETLITPWKELAQKEGLILASPDSRDSSRWSLGDDGPDFLRDVVEATRARHSIDPRRIYLFGHSGGAVFALFMSLLESEYFASVAVHAGAIRPQDEKFFQYAKRKIPVALFVGDRDPFFPLPVVRSTREMFADRGFPALLVEIPNHNHWYYDRGPKINEQVWKFFQGHALAADPRWEQYQMN